MTRTIQAVTLALLRKSQDARPPHGSGYLDLGLEAPGQDASDRAEGMAYCTADFFEDGFDFDVGVGD